MTAWHTYGVVLRNRTITYTIDNKPWATFTSAGVPTIPMWFGMQTGAKDCSRSTRECVNALTPVASSIYIDWVAHWSAT